MSPQDEYKQRLARHEALAARYGERDQSIGALRLFVGVAALVVAWLAFYLHAISPLWLFVPIAVFVGVVVYHRSVRSQRARADRTIQFYQARLARMEDRWVGTGSSGAHFESPHHVYASDLDLFGKGSLFELLCAARTRMGEDTLASWMLDPASRDTVHRRHECLADLRNRMDLREDIAILGEHANVGVRPNALLEWVEAPNVLRSGWIRGTALVLPVLAIAGAALWSIQSIATPLLLILVIEAAILQGLRKDLAKVLQGTEVAFEDLRLFAALLLRLEAEPFQAEPLRALVARLASHALPASQTIAKLSSVVSFVEARRNPILAVLEVPLMYSVHTAFAAERWRAAHGTAVRAWVEAIGEFEALLSISAHSYEHPEDPLPELVEGGACFEGTALGHPLIPAAHCVRNDVSICNSTRVLLVSGSNMSGKSTLLRTVGINTVLAMLGAPVRARQLKLTPLQVGASIRINDSLHEGSSRFYAEITRLRQLLGLADGPLPLLFLLDELLQGTNSKDRRIGAEGVVRAFVQRRAIGLISTHDLALTDIGGLEPGSLHNVHFQDEIVHGAMKFDFRLREGVVTRSNGIELMRSIGLDV